MPRDFMCEYGNCNVTGPDLPVTVVVRERFDGQRPRFCCIEHAALWCAGQDALAKRGRKSSFLICPVRGVDPATSQAFVAKLESEGWTVHWPPRDTNQDDVTGLRICRDNLAAIRAASVVHVIWDGKSEGCLFDLGMAFALDKRIIALSLPGATEGKSFQNMIATWQRGD